MRCVYSLVKVENSLGVASVPNAETDDNGRFGGNVCILQCSIYIVRGFMCEYSRLNSAFKKKVLDIFEASVNFTISSHGKTVC